MAVKERFAGLEERCRVFNNDELADALVDRDDELSKWPSKWRFEILDLLLRLSDLPADKTRIEDLNLLERPVDPVPLTWADIWRGDPLDNSDGLWDDVDFGEASSESGEGSLWEDGSSADSALDISFTSAEDLERHKEVYNTGPDCDGLKAVRESRRLYTDAVSAGDPLTEIQVVRETLSMLHGLPSFIFKESKETVWFRTTPTIERITSGTIDGVLKSFCDLGSRISAIRRWACKEETMPILQTLQSSLTCRLQEADRKLSQLEQRCRLAEGAPPTLASIGPEVNEITRYLVLLDFTRPSQVALKQRKGTFVLDSLFELTCSLQALGDIRGYSYAAGVLFECLQTYLKPLRAWMQHGVLDWDECFFIKRSSRTLPPYALWSEQYILVRDDENGELNAPNFLRPLAPKVFASGKAINFLKTLGTTSPIHAVADELPLSFASVTQQGSDMISPFGELLALSLDQWVESKRSLSATQLLNRLTSQFSLYDTFGALELIYFSRNGALAQQTAYAIFDRIDRGKRWQDRFALTDLFRDRLGAETFVDEDKLSVRIVGSSALQQAQQRSILKLACLAITYDIPGQIATIIKPDTLPIYQRVGVLLLQLLRAKQLLDRQSFQLGHLELRTTTDQRTSLALRHRFRWFVETLQNYVMKEVLEPTTSKLRSQISKAEDLDSLLDLHAIHMAEVEVSCMLAHQQSSSHQALVSLLDLIVVFSDLCSANLFGSAPVADRLVADDDDSDSFSEDEDSTDKARQGPKSSQDSAHAQLATISATYSRLLHFVYIGAREASRAQKGSLLQALVDDLKFGIGDP